MNTPLDKNEFIKRLKAILKLRKALTKDDVKHVLNTFWKFNKDKIDVKYQYSCYETVVRVMKTFKAVIEGSRGHYYFVSNKVLLEAVY